LGREANFMALFMVLKLSSICQRSRYVANAWAVVSGCPEAVAGTGTETGPESAAS
jgi:hypothetical protein